MMSDLRACLFAAINGPVKAPMKSESCWETPLRGQFKSPQGQFPDVPPVQRRSSGTGDSVLLGIHRTGPSSRRFLPAAD